MDTKLIAIGATTLTLFVSSASAAVQNVYTSSNVPLMAAIDQIRALPRSDPRPAVALVEKALDAARFAGADRTWNSPPPEHTGSPLEPLAAADRTW